MSVHYHKHRANLGKHGCLGAKWSGQSESSQAYLLLLTFMLEIKLSYLILSYNIDMELHYV